MKNPIKVDLVGVATLEVIAELGERVGAQRLVNTFHIVGLDALPTHKADRLPKVDYRKSRGRNGKYVNFTIHVYHLNDGSFLYHHPYCKLKETSSVTTVGESTSGLIIPANVDKVTVIDVKRHYRDGAKLKAFELEVTNYAKNVHNL